MLKTVREKINAFLLFLENFGSTKVPGGFKNTYDVLISFILIVILLSGLFSVASFISFANLMVLAFIVFVVVGFAWLFNQMHSDD